MSPARRTSEPPSRRRSNALDSANRVGASTGQVPSLAEIRRRVRDPGAAFDTGLLRLLRRDPRKGAREVARQIERRQLAARAERDRMEALLALERSYWARGITRIAGVDEAGAGPLAGPVVAGAVLLSPEARIEGVNDSKQLDPRTRETLDREIRRRAIAIGIGLASVYEIDRINIRQATLLAMRRALDDLGTAPQQVLIDARTLDDLPWPQEARVRGDASVHCIACASVAAKVYRDRLMDHYDDIYPGYGFRRHKGYGTASHLQALRRLGPSAIHRQTFRWGGQRQLVLFDAARESR
jgi:ribonuclease HII